jgi:hypothetical protein
MEQKRTIIPSVMPATVVRAEVLLYKEAFLRIRKKSGPGLIMARIQMVDKSMIFPSI